MYDTTQNDNPFVKLLVINSFANPYSWSESDEFHG